MCLWGTIKVENQPLFVLCISVAARLFSAVSLVVRRSADPAFEAPADSIPFLFFFRYSEELKAV